ncbi:Sodium/calcium exchanger 3 [Takifugu flavidus]|uniref:Sodium/calcium exchanger 3 n=1 Tax=Takifugu flavidus TaxID=433684 RepID=A0A5C6NYK1_9TELE|nr:Sodium/calcium exchanger 3 [Takifugu flavidus]
MRDDKVSAAGGSWGCHPPSIPPSSSRCLIIEFDGTDLMSGTTERQQSFKGATSCPITDENQLSIKMPRPPVKDQFKLISVNNYVGFYVPDRKLTSDEEEVRRIAEMGKPVLGEHSKLEVIIEESYEFKSTVDKLIKKTNLALVVGTNSWRDQFMEAITVSADEDEEDTGEERLPSCFDYVMHFLTVFWKVLFACVPPTDYLNGWACFVISIVIIGLLTAVIGDLASHFGCTIGLKDSVTAVVFVALGTSVPDMFASKVSAVQDTYADASIGNVTGSNAVNVFLGIGMAWSVAAIYWNMKGENFVVPAGSLAFSVTLFTIFAFLAVSMLLYRRRAHIGGELGGPRGHRLATSAFFFCLWLLYILFSSLESYCLIEGF